MQDWCSHARGPAAALPVINFHQSYKRIVTIRAFAGSQPCERCPYYGTLKPSHKTLAFSKPSLMLYYLFISHLTKDKHCDVTTLARVQAREELLPEGEGLDNRLRRAEALQHGQDEPPPHRVAHQVVQQLPPAPLELFSLLGLTPYHLHASDGPLYSCISSQTGIGGHVPGISINPVSSYMQYQRSD